MKLTDEMMKAGGDAIFALLNLGGAPSSREMACAAWHAMFAAMPKPEPVTHVRAFGRDGWCMVKPGEAGSIPLYAWPLPTVELARPHPGDQLKTVMDPTARADYHKSARADPVWASAERAGRSRRRSVPISPGLAVNVDRSSSVSIRVEKVGDASLTTITVEPKRLEIQGMSHTSLIAGDVLRDL